MYNKKINFIGTHDLPSDPFFLDYEEDHEFLEWCVLEGSEKISELSRQLRSYLNYKCAIIRSRFSKSREGLKTPKKESILKIEIDLSSLFSQYVKILKTIRVEDGTIADSIQILMQEIRTKNNYFTTKLLKDMKSLSSDIWKRLHNLSELEVHLHPRLLNVVLQIASVLCSAQGALYLPFFDFYQELKQNYVQLEKKSTKLLQLNERTQFETKRDKQRVRIVE